MTTHALTRLNLVASVGNLDAYVHWVQRLPLLTLEEEQKFAYQWRTEGDLEAARSLVLAHLRFVVKIARGYTHYGLPLSDLIQEGNIGLMKAVKRFNETVGVRLVSFAVHWIKAEIQEFILRNWRLVKIATTKAQRKLFFNLHKIQKKLTWFSRAEAKKAAKDLNVQPHEVLEMEARLASPDVAFESATDDEDAEKTNGLSPAGYLVDESSDPAQLIAANDYVEIQREQLASALQTLDTRSQDIVRRRWLAEDAEKATLQQLAKDYCISIERVRQLEVAAMKKLRTQLQSPAII